MEETTENNKQSTIVNLGTNILAVVGGVAIVGLFVWGGIQTVRLVPQSFSGLSTVFENLTAAVTNFTSIFRADETISFTFGERTLASDEPFVFTWEHGGKTDRGSYQFVFTCSDGVYFDTESGDRTLCESPITISDEQTAISLIPVSANNRFVDVSVFISFVPEGSPEPRITTTAFLTIENKDITDSRSALGEGEETSTESEETEDTSSSARSGTRVITPTAGTEKTEVFPFPTAGTPSVTPTTGISDPNGVVDLSVRILSVGMIDANTNLFTAATSVPRNMRGAVRFEIINLGTKTSGVWSFSAELPTTPFFVFRPNEKQQPLAPGERIEYTLGFDRVSPKENAEIAINVDPARDLVESTRENNRAASTITFTEI